MFAPSPHRSRGYSQIDLLVVLVITLLVLFCVLPAIYDGGHGPSRSAVCLNNMHCLAMALNQYEVTQGEYPGYLNPLTLRNGQLFTDPQNGKATGVSFAVLIFSQLDRPDLLDLWKSPFGPTGSKDRLRVSLDYLTCPSDPATSPNSPRLAYVVNCGMEDCAGSPSMPRDWEDNGVFFDHFSGDPKVVAAMGGSPDDVIPIAKMSSRFIVQHDGLANTIMLSENCNSGEYTDNSEAKLGMVWNGSGRLDMRTTPPNLTPPYETMQINHNIGEGAFLPDEPTKPLRRILCARPSSRHPGGVNVAFCGGNQRFLSDQIDYYVYCLLMSTNGKNVREPGTNVVLPNFSGSLKDSWIY